MVTSTSSTAHNYVSFHLPDLNSDSLSIGCNQWESSQKPDPLAKELDTSDTERTKEILCALKEKDRLDDINHTQNGYETPLYKAAQAGNLEKVRLLVENGAKDFVNCTNTNGAAWGATALYIAAAMGHVEVVEYLLYKEARANIYIYENRDHQYGSSDSLLFKLVSHYASHETAGAAQCLELLCNTIHPSTLHGLLNNQGENLLKIALEAGQLDIAHVLVKFGAKWEDLDNEALLHNFFAYTIKKGRLDIVEWMCEKYPINLAYRLRDGLTWLHLAAYYNREDIVKFLREKGADENAVSKQGENYLEYSERIAKECAALTIPHVFLPDPLSHVGLVEGATQWDVLKRDPDPLVKELYKSDLARTHEILIELDEKDRLGDINTTHSDDRTPLYRAAAKGDLEKVRLLVQAGAKDFIACDHAPGIAYKSTALCGAAINGRVEVVEYLLSEGARANIYISPYDPSSSLYHNSLLLTVVSDYASDYALNKKRSRHNIVPSHTPDIMEREVQCLRQIIKFYTPNEMNKKGKELLKIALEADRLDIAMVLIERGAKWDDLDDQNKRHNFFTSLIEEGCSNVAMWMCENGSIDLNHRLPDGLTWLHLAASHRREDIVKSLIEKGADENAVSEQGETYQQYATRTLSERAAAAISYHFETYAGFKEFPDFTTAVSYLLEKDINLPVKEGNTFLHLAAKDPLRERTTQTIIPGLLAKGADKSIKNNQGQTPYDVGKKIIDDRSWKSPEDIQQSEQFLKLLSLE